MLDNPATANIARELDSLMAAAPPHCQHATLSCKRLPSGRRFDDGLTGSGLRINNIRGGTCHHRGSEDHTAA
jgi:hypothetical protein